MVRLTWACVVFLLVALGLAAQGCIGAPAYLQDGRPVPGTLPLEAVHHIVALPVGSSCTGVAISGDAMLTAKHCTEVAGVETYVSYAAHEAQPLLEVLDVAPEADLATLTSLGAAFGSTATVELGLPPAGSEVYIAGFGCSGVLEVRAVQYMGSGSFEGRRYMAFLGHACYGDSGGPVFDASGVVVGITTNKAADGSDPDMFWAVSPGEF